MKKFTYLFILLLMFSNVSIAQLNFYEASFQGGVTSGGWSPSYNANGAGNFQVFIAPGSTILKAYFIGSRLGNAANATVDLNGINYTFSAANQVTGPFNTIYGGASGVHVIDVTTNINPLVTNYTLTLPAQPSTSDRYQDFKLIIYYANNLLPVVHTALFLNTDDLTQPNHSWNLNFIVPISNTADVGISFFNSYQCSMGGDAEKVYVNGTLLGLVGLNDLNSGFCGGTLGNMYYQNNSLTAIGDDIVNQGVNQFDALSNSVALIPNNSTTVTVDFQHNSGASDNHQWSVLVVYGGCSTSIAGTVTGAPLTICSGDSSTLTLTGSSGTIQWQSSIDGGITWNNILNANTSIYNASALSTTTCYQAAVTGCGPTVYSNSVCVTVNPAPTVTVPANATYCAGDPVLASNFTSNMVGATFAWTNNNSAIGLATSGTGNTPAFTSTNSSGSTIISTISVTPTANSCVGTPSNYTITVYPTPIAPTADNDTVCPNNSTTLTATAPGGTYEWFDAPVAGTLLSTGASYTTPVLFTNTTYYVQTTVNGCVSPRAAISVIMATTLIVDAGLNDSICFGGSYTLGVTPNGAGYSYVWDEPANMGFSTIFNPTVNPTSTTTYTVTVTDASNCVGSDVVTIYADPQILLMMGVTNVSCNSFCDGQTTVVVNGGTTPYNYNWTSGGLSATEINLCPTLNTVTVTDAFGCIATGDTTITEPTPISIPNVIIDVSCYNANNGQIVVAPQGGTPNYSYSWSVGGVGNSPVANNLDGGQVVVMVTDANGCTQDSTFTVVEPAQINFISFVGTPLSGCSPLTVSFTNTTDTSLITNILWDLGNGNSPTNDTVSTVYTTPGSYTVSLTVTDNNGCSGTLPKIAYVTVYDNPDANFTSLPEQVTLFDPTIDFIDQSQFNIISWFWNFNDLGNSGIQNPSFTFPEDTGTYQVSLLVEDGNGCKDSIVKTVVVKGEYGIFVPNAFTPDGNGENDIFIPKGFGITNKDYSFVIFDRWGELIFETHSMERGWDGTYKGKLVPNGTYVWSVSFTDFNGKKHLNKIGSVSIVN